MGKRKKGPAVPTPKSNNRAAQRWLSSFRASEQRERGPESITPIPSMWHDGRTIGRFVAMDSGLGPSGRPGMSRSWVLLHLGDHLLRHPYRVEHDRGAGIEPDVQEDLADFLLGDAVGDRAADMPAQLMLAIQNRQHCEVEHAARLAAQAVAAPHRAPAVLGDEILDRLADIVLVRRECAV